MPIKLSGSTSGYTQIQAAAVAGNNTLTLPTSGTNLLADNGSGALTIQTINSGTSNALTLQSNNTTAMTIDTSQNVGIGTSSPSAKLDLYNGGSQLKLGMTATGNGFAITNDPAYTLFQTANAVYMGFGTNGTERMRIDSSGNVGIGTTTPGGLLQVGAGTGGIKVTFSNSAGVGRLDIPDNYAGGPSLVFGNETTTGWSRPATNSIATFTGGTERMRINSSGNLLVGTTSALSGSERVTVVFSSNSGPGLILSDSTIQNGTTFAGFYASTTRIGSITANGTTAVSYNTSSDYRLKENVQPMTTGLATIGALNPVTYDWISDKTQGEGFIAHELQEVIPHAVTGDKDAVNEDGTINPQGVDYSKIVVHLVAAIQELSAKLDAQSTDIAALKAKVGA